MFPSEGEDWLKMRSVLRQLIMRPRDVAVFSDDVNGVVDDLIQRVYSLRTQQPDRATVLNVNDLFFKYAMEGWYQICRLLAVKQIPVGQKGFISGSMQAKCRWQERKSMRKTEITEKLL